MFDLGNPTSPFVLSLSKDVTDCPFGMDREALPARSYSRYHSKLASYTYMLLCADGKYYVGHTENLEQRIAQHQSGLTGGFTLRRRPVTLVWSEYFPTRLEALTVERQIKGWTKAKKAALAAGDWERLSELARNRAERKGD